MDAERDTLRNGVDYANGDIVGLQKRNKKTKYENDGAPSFESTFILTGNGYKFTLPSAGT